MKRSHVLAVILGATALVWIASVNSGDVTVSGSTAPSPAHPAIRTQPLGGDPDRSLEIEVPSYGDHMRVSVDADMASDTGEGSRIWGHVVDALGQPVAGATIGLWPQRDKSRTVRRTWQENKDLTRDAKADAAGRYEMTNVLPGSYGIQMESGAGQGVGLLRKITVEADLEVDFRLVGFLELGGRIVRVHSGPVQLQLARGAMRMGGRLRFAEDDLPSTTVGDDGRFVFSGLRPGTYRIRASGSGHARASFDFDLGAPIHDARLVLQTGLQFAGKIELGFETDREGVRMLIQETDTNESRQSWHVDGQFDHADLLPGVYDVRIGANIKDEPWRWMSRNFVVTLEKDLTDFIVHLKDSTPVGISVSLPNGAPTTEGLLSARSGSAREEVKVRIDMKSGALKHQTWSSDGYIPNWATSESLHLDLQRGEWELRLELLGYEPWTRSITVADDNQHTALVDPVPGRILEAGYSSKYFRVEVRPTGTGMDWRLLLWRDGRVQADHFSVPEVTSAFLSPGTYDFRVASIDEVGRAFERIKVESSREKFRFNFKLSKGASIRGKLENRDGSRVSGQFYLYQLVEGSWSYREAKTCVWAGSGFEFRGLGPGRYRGTLDRGGKCVVAEWQVDGKDIDDQRVIAWPLAMR